MNQKSFVKFGIILLIEIISICGVYGQNMKFTHYGIEEGLPSPETYFAHQDAKGYMWFGTDRGLCFISSILSCELNKQNQKDNFSVVNMKSENNKIHGNSFLEVKNLTLGGLFASNTRLFSDVFYNCVGYLTERVKDLSDEDPNKHGTKVVINIPII